MSRNGVSAQGYGIGLDEFMNGLGAGEQATVWVNKNHFVTVLKNEDGTLDLIDPQKNNGQAQTYEAQEFKKLFNEEALDSYTDVLDDKGRMKVLTDSQGVAQQGELLNAQEMGEIKGARVSPGYFREHKPLVLKDRPSSNKPLFNRQEKGKEVKISKEGRGGG